MPLKQETQNENKETRQHLLECAKREFLEKGYMKASLRNICKEAGVTTGRCIFSSRIRKICWQHWWKSRCGSCMQ